MATARGRLGMATGNALAFVTGGVAVAELTHCIGGDPDLYYCKNSPVQQNSHNDYVWNDTVQGLVAGAGVEGAIGEHLSLKAEWFYTQFQHSGDVGESQLDYRFDTSGYQMRVGVNWHLNPIAQADQVTADGEEWWTGIYGGLQAGIGSFTGQGTDWGNRVWDDTPTTNDLPGFAGLAGGQAGFNLQHGNLVLGVEGDIAWTGFDESHKYDYSSGNQTDTTYDIDQHVAASIDWLATARGRLGAANGGTMAYVTGGMAFAQGTHCAGNQPFTQFCKHEQVGGEYNIALSDVFTGLVVGAGVETRLTDRLSLKAEWLHVQLEPQEVSYQETNTPGVDLHMDFNTEIDLVRVGLNWHFN